MKYLMRQDAMCNEESDLQGDLGEKSPTKQYLYYFPSGHFLKSPAEHPEQHMKHKS
jgi:hypothetical protein